MFENRESTANEHSSNHCVLLSLSSFNQIQLPPGLKMTIKSIHLTPSISPFKHQIEDLDVGILMMSRRNRMENNSPHAITYTRVAHLLIQTAHALNPPRMEHVNHGEEVRGSE